MLQRPVPVRSRRLADHLPSNYEPVEGAVLTADDFTPFGSDEDWDLALAPLGDDGDVPDDPTDAMIDIMLRGSVGWEAEGLNPDSEPTRFRIALAPGKDDILSGMLWDDERPLPHYMNPDDGDFYPPFQPVSLWFDWVVMWDAVGRGAPDEFGDRGVGELVMGEAQSFDEMMHQRLGEMEDLEEFGDAEPEFEPYDGSLDDDEFPSVTAQMDDFENAAAFGEWLDRELADYDVRFRVRRLALGEGPLPELHELAVEAGDHPFSKEESYRLDPVAPTEAFFDQKDSMGLPVDLSLTVDLSGDFASGVAAGDVAEWRPFLHPSADNAEAPADGEWWAVLAPRPGLMIPIPARGAVVEVEFAIADEIEEITVSAALATEDDEDLS